MESEKEDNQIRNGCIHECIRFFASQQDGRPKVAHCYLKYSEDGRTIHSRGYFQEGSFEEPFPDSGQCRIAKGKSNIEEWGKIIEKYSEYNSEHYSLTSNNCCTVTKEALNSIGISGCSADWANLGIGTTFNLNSLNSKK